MLLSNIRRTGQASSRRATASKGLEHGHGYRIQEPLFAEPRVTAGDEDDALVLRSAEPLAGYPVTVMHSVRAWAAADPGHPMVAERTAAGGGRTCGYGEAVAAASAIGQALVELLYAGPAPGCPEYPAGIVVAERTA